MSTRREVAGLLAYYLFLGLVWWLLTRDVPLRVSFWYYLNRSAKHIAYYSGRIGIRAEHAYHTQRNKVYL